MGIQRQFTATCDKCGTGSDEAFGFAQMVRDWCRNEGWTISGNKFTCPVCNKRNTDYWTNLGYHGQGDVIEVS